MAQVSQEEKEEGRAPAVKMRGLPTGDEVLRNLERRFCLVGLLLLFLF